MISNFAKFDIKIKNIKKISYKSNRSLKFYINSSLMTMIRVI